MGAGEVKPRLSPWVKGTFSSRAIAPADVSATLINICLVGLSVVLQQGSRQLDHKGSVSHVNITPVYVAAEN